ncbi:hypothetical protein BP00DRAFT_231544 [Aspergillus indologenus CBS 114.80]|uniref:Uncharacterized protein n=1 Tax=Aspergillus indologenus CBS 114.80 TaxID=1450541 RepID=A0A2V5I0N8_9EURO|nr:hypothetical protein BP00DRAFT_231544 [Aspergillus indologenus CBS 114.80]
MHLCAIHSHLSIQHPYSSNYSVPRPRTKPSQRHKIPYMATSWLHTRITCLGPLMPSPPLPKVDQNQMKILPISKVFFVSFYFIFLLSLAPFEALPASDIFNHQSAGLPACLSVCGNGGTKLPQPGSWRRRRSRRRRHCAPYFVFRITDTGQSFLPLAERNA